MVLFTEIISEAVRKNQPPLTLIMQFHSRGMVEFGTSSFQKRCQRVRRNERAASSSSCGSVSSELRKENVMFHAWLVKMANTDAASTPSIEWGNRVIHMVMVAERNPRTGTD